MGFLSAIISISRVNGDGDCVYTNVDGKFCNCDGSNKFCMVALVQFDECGDASSELQVLVDQCVQSHAKVKSHKAYKNTCSFGEVTKSWYHTEDCSGKVTKTEILSESFDECATITCTKPKLQALDTEMEPYVESKSAASSMLIAALLTFACILF